MDALCAILSKEFKESDWCDQEVGYGLGRHVLCIPIRRDVVPYGILGIYQGTKQSNKAKEVAGQIFSIICDSDKTRQKYIEILSNLFLDSNNENDAKKWLSVIKQVKTLTRSDVQYIHDYIAENEVLFSYDNIIDKVNKMCKNYSIEPIITKTSDSTTNFDDLPF